MPFIIILFVFVISIGCSAKPIPFEKPSNRDRVEKIISSTVGIVTDKGFGTGVIYSPEGDNNNYILTVSHIFPEGSQDPVVNIVAKVYAKEKNVFEYRVLQAKLLKRDEGYDLAVLSIGSSYNTIPITGVIPKSDLRITFVSPQSIGIPIYHYSLALPGNGFLSKGVLADEFIENEMMFITGNCVVLPGSSGGGFFTTKGDLVGIATKASYFQRQINGIIVRDFSNHLNIAVSSNEIYLWMLSNNLPLIQIK